MVYHINISSWLAKEEWSKEWAKNEIMLFYILDYGQEMGDSVRTRGKQFSSHLRFFSRP